MKKSTKCFFFGFLSNILLTSAYKLSAPYFECGPHGRFEYCIDNIPGCIVGCHCHPGYYFDTDTKVCEPNTKIRVDFRRQYVEEPTLTPLVTTEISPTPTTKSLIDKNVDAIAQDADDLGDWLYNQFFKAIENQVINKTEDKPTRRSGSDSTANGDSTSKPLEQPKLKIQRRSRRRHGKKPSKKKRSKKGLRRKLLRISEDDSLFDSSSGSSSSDDSSSSCSSESSSESESKERSKNRNHNHGRKILMINKKPPIPLPSFIFMPNMETPYFPPLGLPAPPPIPMPMYPMLPVPPVIPMPSPPPPTTEAVHTTEAPHTESHHTTEPSHRQTGKPEGGEEEHASEKPAEEDPTRSRSSRKFRTGKGKRKPNMRANAKETAKDRFIKRVQEKIRARHRMHQQQESFPHELFDSFLEHNYPDFESNPHAAFEVNENPDVMYEELNPHSEDMPYDQNVNFKYLSQLIHKLNNTDFQMPSQQQPVHLLQQKLHPNLPPNLLPNQPPNSYPNLHPSSHPIPYPNPRKNLHTNPNSITISKPNVNSNPYPQNIKTLPLVRDKPLRRSGNSLVVNYTVKDDYADLGRQIAALVRKIDVKGEREIDVNFEGEKSMPSIPAIFNDNGFSSRSYWERYARSPFEIRFEDDNFIHIDSNEQLQLQQRNLEDQVNKAATTPRTLNLHQLENIISLIQLIKSVQVKQMKMDIPKAPTRLSLLAPLQNYSDYNLATFSLKPESPEIAKSLIEARSEEKIYNKTQPQLQAKFQDNFENKLQGTTEKKLNYEKSRSTKLNSPPPNSYIPRGLIKPSKTNKYSYLNNYAPPKQRFKIPLSRLLQHAAIYPMNARLQNQNLQRLNTKKYRQNTQHLHMDNYKKLGPNKGIYRHYENTIKAPSFSLGKKNKPSSFFHHQVNHFDYFD